MDVKCKAHRGGNQKGFEEVAYVLAVEPRYMAKRPTDTGTETETASDLKPRLAMAILFSRLLLLVLSFEAVDVGSRLVRCLRLWEFIFFFFLAQ